MGEASLSQALLSRQTIVDRQEELVGYEIALQPVASPVTVSAGENQSVGAAILVSAAYAELGIRSALGQHAAYLRVTPDFLFDDALEALPPEAVVLELVLEGAPDARLLERCRALRERRYALALTDYAGLDARSTPLLNLLDTIIIDTRRHEAAALAALAGPLARLPLRLMAQGVDTRATMADCRMLGFALFQGDFFAQPEMLSGRRLSASQGALIQLINLAGRDADTALLEAAIKHEPALAVNLLRIVNSVGYGAVGLGAARRIGSLRHAITLLGRRQLQRWLQLLLMAPSGQVPDATRSPLLQLAALRGRMLEMLLETSRPGDRKLSDQAFIVGLMTMMPTALGLPLTAIFEQIALETEVVQALSGHAGVLGEALALLECFDAEDLAGCDRLIARGALPGINVAILNTCLVDSLRWVNASNE